MRALPLLVLLLVPCAAVADGVTLAQLRVRQRVVIRIPRMGPTTARPLALATPIVWKERKGPKCIAASGLAGALITQSGTVDLVVKGGQRYRAMLGDDCPTLGFYSGFYVKPTDDGMICADRDAIRARSGRACPIDRFRRLEARPAK